jgi:hypothetical protein
MMIQMGNVQFDEDKVLAQLIEQTELGKIPWHGFEDSYDDYRATTGGYRFQLNGWHKAIWEVFSPRKHSLDICKNGTSSMVTIYPGHPMLPKLVSVVSAYVRKNDLEREKAQRQADLELAEELDSGLSL